MGDLRDLLGFTGNIAPSGDTVTAQAVTVHGILTSYELLPLDSPSATCREIVAGGDIRCDDTPEDPTKLWTPAPWPGRECHAASESATVGQVGAALWQTMQADCAGGKLDEKTARMEAE